MSVISVQRLRKAFGDFEAVRGLDLEIAAGEVIGLLGPSGCGKTTTLRCIAGLEDPTGGRIVLNGTEVYSDKAYVPPEKRGIGMVFQSYALWPHMTVEKNVEFALGYSDVPKERHSAATERSLAAVGMETLRHRYPNELSGGQQQRVAVARAIVAEPSVLLFDEPLSNLDAKLRNSVRLELKSLLRELNATAMYVTHDQHEALALCDRIALMFDGDIRQLGSPEEVYGHPADMRVAAFVGDTNLLPFKAVDDPSKGARTVEVAGESFDADVDDRTGYMLIRPEHLDLYADVHTPSTAYWTGQVVEVLFAGLTSEFIVEFDNQPGMKVTAFQADFDAEVGDKVKITPRPGKPLWLRHDDGAPWALEMALSRVPQDLRHGEPAEGTP